MPGKYPSEPWHLDKRITLNQILTILVQAVVLVVAIATFWWWLNDSISGAADEATDAANRISEVAGDVGDVEDTAKEALVMARSNKSGLAELRGRVERNEVRQTKRDEELIKRLQRIENLLLERGNDR